MKRVAALYDIHGNTPALEAVLAELATADVDLVVIGGDFVSGPEPAEVLALLRSVPGDVRFIRGNCERVIVECWDRARRPGGDLSDADAFAAAMLADSDVSFLAALDATLTLDIEYLGETQFCHGSPRSDKEVLTARTPEARLRETITPGVRLVVCGHTHMQFDRLADGCRFINAGSVGMPYGSPGAYWALLGPQVALRRTDYDLDRAASRLRLSTWPGANDFAEHNVRRPPSAEEALDLFELTATTTPEPMVHEARAVPRDRGDCLE